MFSCRRKINYKYGIWIYLKSQPFLQSLTTLYVCAGLPSSNEVIRGEKTSMMGFSSQNSCPRNEACLPSHFYLFSPADHAAYCPSKIVVIFLHCFKSHLLNFLNFNLTILKKKKITYTHIIKKKSMLQQHNYTCSTLAHTISTRTPLQHIASVLQEV